MYRMMVGILLASFGLPAFAWGQYGVYPPRPGYRYPNPYVNPYNPYYGAGVGNALHGAADLTRAQGNVMSQTESARLLREQSTQMKIDTKKKAFDEMLYEKANTPTYGEELARDKMAILTRMMNFPIRSEIVDGKTLNVMLPFLQSLSNAGSMGQPVPIPQSKVNELNITGTGTSSIGMLRDGGRVDWPIALRGPLSQRLDQSLPGAVSAAASNALDPKMMRRIRSEMKDLRENMREQLRKEEIETSSYLQAIEFYNSLESSVNALERPDARKQLSGAYSPRARNVQELVDYMIDNGLKFAPATPGSESAYQATHDAFVRYARTAQASSGFQTMNSPVSFKK